MASNVLQPTEIVRPHSVRQEVYNSSVDAIKLNIIITQNLALLLVKADECVTLSCLVFQWSLVKQEKMCSHTPSIQFFKARIAFGCRKRLKKPKHQRQKQHSQKKKKKLKRVVTTECKRHVEPKINSTQAEYRESQWTPRHSVNWKLHYCNYAQIPNKVINSNVKSVSVAWGDNVSRWRTDGGKVLTCSVLQCSVSI